MSTKSKEYKALFFGPFRVITKQKEIVYKFEKDAPIISDMLDQIVDSYPELNEFLFHDNEISDNTSIIINGEDIKGGDGLKTEIKPEDRITFFKAAGGG
jgi:sulfur-carrier protein